MSLKAYKIRVIYKKTNRYGRGEACFTAEREIFEVYMEQINQTTYYANLTAPLRRPIISKNIIFAASGYVYKTDNLAFTLVRLSKNKYRLTMFRPGGAVEERNYNSLETAVPATIRLAVADLSGQI